MPAGAEKMMSENGKIVPGNTMPKALLVVQHDVHAQAMSVATAQDKPTSATPLLARALQRIRSTPPRMITSPPTRAPFIMYCLFHLC